MIKQKRIRDDSGERNGYWDGGKFWPVVPSAIKRLIVAEMDRQEVTPYRLYKRCSALAHSRGDAFGRATIYGWLHAGRDIRVSSLDLICEVLNLKLRRFVP